MVDSSADEGSPNSRPINRRTSRRRLAVAATGVVLVSAVVAPVAGAATAGASKVTFTKLTVVVPASTVKAQLVSVSTNGATYTFKTSHGVLRRLRKGSVMLLQGLAARDVTRTAKSHGHLVVSTTPATITDLVANGTLSWNRSISFANGFGVGGTAVPTNDAARAQAALGSVSSRFGMVPMKGPKGITLTGKTHSYRYSVTFKQTGSAVDVSISITKSSPVEIEAKITGTLDNLTTAGDIAVNHGSFSSAKMLANHLKGSFTLAYSAKPLTQFGLGTAGGVKITLPAELAVPFSVGGVPFFLGIKVAFFASAGFSSFDQRLSGSYTFSDNGEGGFTTSSSGASSAAGVLKGLSDIVLNAKNAVNTGPLSFIFGAQLPEIDLGLGTKGLNIAGNVTLIGSTGIATYGSGCDTRQTEVTGSAGAEASFFGSAGRGDAVRQEEGRRLPGGLRRLSVVRPRRHINACPGGRCGAVIHAKLHNAAVMSASVKSGSLLAKDFKAAQATCVRASHRRGHGRGARLLRGAQVTPDYSTDGEVDGAADLALGQVFC